MPSHIAVPNNIPAPAVIAMASAPQNVTRIILGKTRAPPACAANVPKSIKKIIDVAATVKIRCGSGATAETIKGMSAPTAKLLADASAA